MTKASGVFTCILSRPALRMNSSVGQPWLICQAMCGRKMTPAMRPAIHGPRVHSRRRAGETTSPAANPPAIHAMLILLSSPRPSTTPRVIQRRSAGCSTASIIRRAASVQSRMSKTFIEKKLPSASSSGATAVAAIAIASP